MSVSVEVISFGYLHGDPPAAHLILDLRTHFRDPHFDPALRDMTAHDREIHDTVLNTPGIRALVEATVAMIRAYQAGPSPTPLTVAVGCAGGRHRAAAFAMEVGARTSATVTHRDLSQPVINR